MRWSWVHDRYMTHIMPAGRIFEFVHGEDSSVSLLGPGNLPQVVEALLLAIRDAPHIAEKVRDSISRAADAAWRNVCTAVVWLPKSVHCGVSWGRYL
jgi:hypothetical protein